MHLAISIIKKLPAVRWTTFSHLRRTSPSRAGVGLEPKTSWSHSKKTRQSSRRGCVGSPFQPHTVSIGGGQSCGGCLHMIGGIRVGFCLPSKVNKAAQRAIWWLSALIFERLGDSTRASIKDLRRRGVSREAGNLGLAGKRLLTHPPLPSRCLDLVEPDNEQSKL